MSSPGRSINQSINQLINQSINQSIKQASKQSIKQSINIFPRKVYILTYFACAVFYLWPLVLQELKSVASHIISLRNCWMTDHVINKLGPTHVKRVRPTLWEGTFWFISFSCEAGLSPPAQKSLRVTRSISISRPQAKTHVLFKRIELLIVVYHDAACVIPDVYVVVFLLPMFVPVCMYTGPLTTNWPRSIYQYSNMAPRLSGQNCKFFKFLLFLNSQKRLGYKENSSKYRSLTWKPRSHVGILIYRTWAIVRHEPHFNTEAYQVPCLPFAFSCSLSLPYL